LESVLLGVYCQTWGDDLVDLRFWVWGQKAVGFLSAHSEPVDHDGPPVSYYSKEDFGGREFPPPSARFRAHGRGPTASGPSNWHTACAHCV
jgi:hypothetical protein